MGEIWFWQRMVTPHMAVLASQLANIMGREVIYVAEQPMSAERLAQGWSVPELQGVRVIYAHKPADAEAVVATAPADSIHICQGIRGNGTVGKAQRAIKARGLRHWVVMETVDDAGWQGVLKRLEYRRQFTIWRKHLRGVLAIGQNTPRWIVDRGTPGSLVFPFAYFLADLYIERFADFDATERFRFLFVGNFVELKRLDQLLSCLSLVNTGEFELAVVGSGSLEASLRAMAERLLPGRVQWIGRLPWNKVPEEMAKADCLVLPSRHDGWGAVISEAMMVGTPVVCSDACGAAGVVRASGKGGVFVAGDSGDLIHNLESMLLLGKVKKDDRLSLASSARCLGARAGASYLLDILEYDSGSNKVPMPPWSEKSSRWVTDAQ